MTKFDFLSGTNRLRYLVGIPSVSRVVSLSRPGSVSLDMPTDSQPTHHRLTSGTEPTRQRCATSAREVLKFAAVFALLMTIGVGNVWGDSFSHDYVYSEKGTGTGNTWDVTNAEDASSYWKVPSTTSSPSVVTIEGIFTGKTITSDVVITLNIATYGNGDNPESSKFAIFNSSDCSSQVTASQGGTLPSSSTYTNATYTVTKTNALAGFTDDLAIKIASDTKTKQIRLRKITVSFDYTAKVSTPYTVRFYDTNGSYDDIPEASVGAGVTPPSLSTPCDGWAFQGWSTSQSNSESSTTVLSTVTLSAGKYYPTANTTLYPVYTKTTSSSVTKTYGFETASDVNWTINGTERESGNANSGSYAGKINTANTYVTFKDKVYVTAFSFALKRTTDNKNYNVYIETSTDNSSWSAAETYSMSDFGNGSYTEKSKSWNGNTAYYVRFHCYNTIAVRYVDDVSITYKTNVTYYYSYPSCASCTATPTVGDASLNGAFSLSSVGVTVTCCKSFFYA